MITSKRKLEVELLSELANVLKTIAHPVRLEVLEALEEHKQLCVKELKNLIETEVEQSMLSHHLIKMKANGILNSIKQGKHIIYSLADLQMLNIFDCMERCNFIKDKK